MAQRGRKPLYHTDAEREAANKASRNKSKTKVRNITVDAELVELISVTAGKLEAQFGFRPTVSQTLRHLIKGAAK